MVMFVWRYSDSKNIFKMSENKTNATEDICQDNTFHFEYLDSLDLAARSVITICMGVVMVTTIIFNIVVILRISTKARHKPFTSFFLVSLAIADLFVGIIIMPYGIANFLFDMQTIAGQFSCDVANSSDVMSTTSSIFHLSILTFERFFAICKPFSYRKVCNQTTMILFSLVSWGLSAILSFGLILPGYSTTGLDIECLHHHDACSFYVSKTYAVISASVSFVVPGIFIICCNYKVMTCVHQRRHLLKSSSASFRSGKESRSMRVAKTITTLTICFLLCWIPFVICYILNAFIDYTIPGFVILLVTWLGYVNSAANPILYLLMEGRNCIGRA